MPFSDRSEYWIFDAVAQVSNASVSNASVSNGLVCDGLGLGSPVFDLRIPTFGIASTGENTH